MSGFYVRVFPFLFFPFLSFAPASTAPSVHSLWKGIVEQAWQRAAHRRQRCWGKLSTAERDSYLFACLWCVSEGEKKREHLCICWQLYACVCQFEYYISLPLIFTACCRDGNKLLNSMQQKEEEGFASLFKVIVITSKSTEQSQHLCSVSVILLYVVTCAWTFLSSLKVWCKINEKKRHYNAFIGGNLSNELT